MFILCCGAFLLIGECVLLLRKVTFFHIKPRNWLGERLQNDLFRVEWEVKSQLNQPVNIETVVHIVTASTHRGRLRILVF